MREKSENNAELYRSRGKRRTLLQKTVQRGSKLSLFTHLLCCQRVLKRCKRIFPINQAHNFRWLRNKCSFTHLLRRSLCIFVEPPRAQWTLLLRLVERAHFRTSKTFGQTYVSILRSLKLLLK